MKTNNILNREDVLFKTIDLLIDTICCMDCMFNIKCFKSDLPKQADRCKIKYLRKAKRIIKKRGVIQDDTE